MENKLLLHMNNAHFYNLNRIQRWEIRVKYTGRIQIRFQTRRGRVMCDLPKQFVL